MSMCRYDTLVGQGVELRGQPGARCTQQQRIDAAGVGHGRAHGRFVASLQVRERCQPPRGRVDRVAVERLARRGERFRVGARRW